jgi:DNA-directed RNA polymerase subunit F
VTIAEVKEILEKRAAEATEAEQELSYVQQVTLDYVNKFSIYPLDEALKLKEDLKKKFGLSENTAIQLTNLATPPLAAVELNVILDKDPVTLTEEQKSDLVDVIAAYVEKT